jgi:hypothetical protein
MIDSVIQNPRNRTTLRSRLMLILFASVAIALIPGWRLYSRDLIDVNGFYLVLINAGTASGVLILLERLMLKNWWWPLLAGAIIGIISVILVRQHVTDYDKQAFSLGIIVGLGYLTGGFVFKIWRKSA